jgi:hypothetical protein
VAGTDGGTPARDPSEQKLLGRLRAISIVVVLVLVVLVVIAQVAGRPVGDVFFATLLGAFLALFGFETIARLPGGK